MSPVYYFQQYEWYALAKKMWFCNLVLHSYLELLIQSGPNNGTVDISSPNIPNYFSFIMEMEYNSAWDRS